LRSNGIPSRRRRTSPSLTSTLPFLPTLNRQSLDRAAHLDGVRVRFQQGSRITPSWQTDGHPAASLTSFTERTKLSKLRLQLCSLSQRLIDTGPNLRPPVTDIPNPCPQKMGNPEPLSSTHRIGPQWTQTWEGNKQQEAQWTHTTGLDVFASCQDMNESDTRTVYVCLSSFNSMPLTT